MTSDIREMFYKEKAQISTDQTLPLHRILHVPTLLNLTVQLYNIIASSIRKQTKNLLYRPAHLLIKKKKKPSILT